MIFYVMAALIGFAASALIGAFSHRGVVADLRINKVLVFESTQQLMLESALMQTTADRVVVARMHNGGSEVKAGTKKNGSIVAEAHEDHLHASLPDHQSVGMDAQYIGLMLSLQQSDFVFIETDKLPACALKRRYESEGIKEALFFMLIDTAYSRYFVVFSSKSDTNSESGGMTSNRDFSRIELTVNNLRNLYKRAAQQKILH